MKLFNISLVFYLLFSVQVAFAQDDQPQKVHSIIYVVKDFDWYVKQYKLWEKELGKNKKDPDAWMNFITAARMAKLTSPDDDKKAYWKKTETTSFSGFENNIKGTYEYWILKRWQSFIEWDDIEDPDQLKERRSTIHQYCLNAYAIDPTRWEVYGNLMNTYIEQGDDAKAKEISERWLASGNLTYSLLALNYNSLISCSENAILFTAGDNDTYPAWVLQNGKGFRKDVTIMNIWLAQSNREYRNTVFKKNNIPLLDKNPETKQEIVEHVLTNRGDKDVYFVHWFGAGEYDSLADKVYNVGAVLVYSEDVLSNTSYLIDNYENKYLLDQLKYGIQFEQWPEKAKECNFIYTSGLFHLLDHYTVTEQGKKIAATKQMILNIVSGTQYEEQIKESLEKY